MPIIWQSGEAEKPRSQSVRAERSIAAGGLYVRRFDGIHRMSMLPPRN